MSLTPDLGPGHELDARISAAKERDARIRVINRSLENMGSGYHYTGPNLRNSAEAALLNERLSSMRGVPFAERLDKARQRDMNKRTIGAPRIAVPPLDSLTWPEGMDEDTLHTRSWRQLREVMGLACTRYKTYDVPVNKFLPVSVLIKPG